MPLQLARVSRIHPLTLEILKELIGDKGSVTGTMYAVGYPGNPMGIDNWCFEPHNREREPNKYWQDVFHHRSLRKVPSSNLGDGWVKLELKGDKLVVHPLMFGSGKPLEDQGYPPFEIDPLPPDAEVITFMKPVRDLAFLERVIRSGTKWKLHDRPFYRFERLFEIAAGAVVADTVTSEGTRTVLLLDPARYVPKGSGGQPIPSADSWWEVSLKDIFPSAAVYDIDDKIAEVKAQFFSKQLVEPAHEEIVYVPHQRHPEWWQAEMRQL